MKRLVAGIFVLVVALGSVGAMAGESGNCSPEGTWYGYNDQGAVWIVTITRSGPDSFTTVMDNEANLLEPVVSQVTDWRGEFVRTGPGEYDWTTMALMRGNELAPVPFALGLCPLTAEFTGCDSWQGGGTCEFYGFFDPGDDPFEDSFFLFEGEPLQAFFKRMPMSFPAP